MILRLPKMEVETSRCSIAGVRAHSGARGPPTHWHTHTHWHWHWHPATHGDPPTGIHPPSRRLRLGLCPCTLAAKEAAAVPQGPPPGAWGRRGPLTRRRWPRPSKSARSREPPGAAKFECRRRIAPLPASVPARPAGQDSRGQRGEGGRWSRPPGLCGRVLSPTCGLAAVHSGHGLLNRLRTALKPVMVSRYATDELASQTIPTCRKTITWYALCRTDARNQSAPWDSEH